MAVAPDVLRQVPYFAEIAPALLAELAREARERTYRRGEVILLEGAPCKGLHFVVSGRVKVYKVSGDGKEQVLRILGPGRSFNDVPLFDGGPNPATVAALEPSTVAYLPKARVSALIEGHPEVAGAGVTYGYVIASKPIF